MRHLWTLTAALALLVPAFADDEMMQPGPQHERLYYFLGEWEGDEVFAKSEFVPDGAETVGTYTYRTILNGMFVEYAYETDGEGFHFEGKGLYGFDGMKNVYTMSWFDLTGMSDHAEGAWTDEGLVFEYESQWGEKTLKNRSVIKVLNDDEFSFVFGHVVDGTFREFMHGSYERRGGHAPDSEAGHDHGHARSADLMPCCLAAIGELVAGGTAPECCGHELDGTPGTMEHDCCKKKLAEALGDSLSPCCLKSLLAKDESEISPCCKAAKEATDPSKMPECCQPKKR